mmetsp:Transcript_5494/g.6042  ORF Transcript_5494/g.6042 Transcript_5494/m.6042 type:complete len:230 (-) Transcript_5494:234-923(-)
MATTTNASSSSSQNISNMTSAGRSLRDSLTILQSNIPNHINRKRKIVSLWNDDNREDKNHYDDEALLKTIDSSDEGEPKEEGTKEEDQKEYNKCRKQCIQDLMPFVYDYKGRIVDKKTNDTTSSSLNTISEGRGLETAKAESEKKTDYNNDRIKRERNNHEMSVYIQQLNKLKADNEDIQNKKHKIMERYANLIYSYEYGLHSISKLNDLSYAPDNIMHGNEGLNEEKG